MEQHKITYKTKDGVIKEQRFDEFNEFADAIEDAAMDYFELLTQHLKWIFRVPSVHTV